MGSLTRDQYVHAPKKEVHGLGKGQQESQDFNLDDIGLKAVLKVRRKRPCSETTGPQALIVFSEGQ